MRWKIFIGVFIFLIAIIVVGVLVKNSTSEEIALRIDIAGQTKGVSLSPKSFDGSDFTDFFKKSQELGTIVSWGGDWRELNEKDSAPKVVAKLAKKYDYTPIIIVDFPVVGEEQEFISAITKFVEENEIAYLGIGNEVNFDDNPVAFEVGISTFNSAYDAVKEISPETKVFTIFQYEAMKGLRGGIFGGENNEENAEWNLLSLAEKSDFIGLTTYPGLIYKNPNEIPGNYYEEIQEHTTKKIIFTETGWFRESSLSAEGWDSSQSEQADFIRLFFAQTNIMQPEARIWSFVYDPETEDVFSTMGLLMDEQETSEPYETWKTR